jgi:hypothetical protein
MNLAYICLRKGLPSEADQRAALAAAGATEDELARAWVDDCRRKPRNGQPTQPERDYIPGAARDGDVVLVARLGVLATTVADALRFVSTICEDKVVLQDASTGRRYSVRPEAAQDVADALRLAADIAADERKASLEKARRGIKSMPGAEPSMTEADKLRVSSFWYDQTLTTKEAVAKSGFAERTLYRSLGKRNRPQFGKAITKRRAPK